MELLRSLVDLASIRPPDCRSLLFEDSSFAKHVVNLGIFHELLHAVTDVRHLKNLCGRGTLSRVLGH